MIPLAIILTFFLGNLPATEAGNDLPDLDTFLRNVQKNLRSDDLLQSRYTFSMKQTKFEPDGNGRPQAAEVNEYEVYPSLDREYTYLRHISENGTQLSNEEVEKQDRDHQNKLKKLQKKLDKEGISQEAYQLRTEKIQRKKEERIIGELPLIFDISILGREILDGRKAIVLEIHPQPEYEPYSKETKILSKLTGKVWFCEQDYQLMKAEMELDDNISFGWGLFARLHKGTKIFYSRKYVNDEIWLPAEVRFAGTARVLLLKKIRFNTLSEFSNYRKFTVKASLKFLGKQ
jgi:hypothetical protein